MRFLGVGLGVRCGRSDDDVDDTVGVAECRVVGSVEGLRNGSWL